MSLEHDIDNEEPSVFQFDPYEGSDSSMQPSTNGCGLQTIAVVTSSIAVPSHDNSPTSEEHGENEESAAIPDTGRKGKAATRPMPIRPSMVVHDLFDLSSNDSGAIFASSSRELEDVSSSSPPTPSSFIFSSSFDPNFTQCHHPSSSHEATTLPEPSLHEGNSYSSDAPLADIKGKGKEKPPTLPPLAFSMTELGYSEIGWPSAGFTPATPGPSSYGSAYSPPNSRISPPTATENLTIDMSSAPTPHSANSAALAGQDLSLGRPPSRCRSLSSFSVDSTRSLTSSTQVKQKSGLPKSPTGNLARKLFGKNVNISDPMSPTCSTPISEEAGNRVLDFGTVNVSSSSHSPWYASSKLHDIDLRFAITQQLLAETSQQTISASFPSRSLLKRNGRSLSAPIPFSALDYVPVTSNDVFEPLPLLIRNYFEEVLPKELRLHILICLVELHEDDYQRALVDPRWTALKASSAKNQWVGRDKGVRELFKLSRVSKSWQMLIYDGQIWTGLDVHSFPGLPQSVLSMLSKAGGSFIRSLNVAGHVHLLPKNLIEMADNLSLRIPKESLSFAQLTTINFHGCSALTTRSLHHLLVRSRFLERLNLKGLSAVTNTTCDIIATFCPQLVSLNMSRCSNMDAEGIRCLAVAAIARHEYLHLKELRISGLKHASDSMMRALGQAAPYLEILDISYVRQLHNSALEAFVACDMDSKHLEAHTIKLTARELGRDFDDALEYRRRITRLRHLSVSYCMLLTDIACSNISHSVPQLEFFEMAGIGSDLKDDGLIRLLNTTPFIRRLDLEDASDISDSVLAAVTPLPNTSDDVQQSNREPQTGHALEQLIVSYAHRLTDNALLALIRNCPRLIQLEADNTRMGATVLREFVRLSRQRKPASSKIVAVDCRGIGEGLIKDISAMTRPRKGWRAFAARKLAYLDARDGNEDELNVGQDECDPTRVVVKTFYSWQTVDAVRSAREKRRKSSSRRAANDSVGSEYDEFPGRGTNRWWSPGGRRSGSNSPPMFPDMGNDGCRVM